MEGERERDRVWRCARLDTPATRSTDVHMYVAPNSRQHHQTSWQPHTCGDLLLACREVRGGHVVVVKYVRVMSALRPLCLSPLGAASSYPRTSGRKLKNEHVGRLGHLLHHRTSMTSSAPIFIPSQKPTYGPIRTLMRSSCSGRKGFDDRKSNESTLYRDWKRLVFSSLFFSLEIQAIKDRGFAPPLLIKREKWLHTKICFFHFSPKPSAPGRLRPRSDDLLRLHMPSPEWDEGSPARYDGAD